MRRGFTLFEVTAVVLVMGLLAALVVPNLAAMSQARETRLAWIRLINLAKDARTQAQVRGGSTTIRYDANQRAFTLDWQALEVAETEEPGLESPDQADTNAQGQRIGTVELPQGIEPSAFRRGRETLDGGTWSLAFYDDGTSEEGGVEFDDAGAIRSLWVPAGGQPEWREQELPEVTETDWEAGELEQRL